MKRGYLEKVELNPNWFKVRLRSVQIVNGRQETYDCFTSGTDLESTRTAVKNSVGMAWIVRIKQIMYDDMINELENK